MFIQTVGQNNVCRYITRILLNRNDIIVKFKNLNGDVICVRLGVCVCVCVCVYVGYAHILVIQLSIYYVYTFVGNLQNNRNTYSVELGKVNSILKLMFTHIYYNLPNENMKSQVFFFGLDNII